MRGLFEVTRSLSTVRASSSVAVTWLRLDGGGKAHLEATQQPFLEGVDLVGWPVAGEQDLSAGLVDRVERVEELFLEALLAGEELDVVDQEDVDFPVALLELGQRPVSDRFDEAVHELLARDVPHSKTRVLVGHIGGDGAQEVRLAEAGGAVDEQGVVVLCRLTGHGECGGVGEPVRGADDEVVEGEPHRLCVGVHQKRIGFEGSGVVTVVRKVQVVDRCRHDRLLGGRADGVERDDPEEFVVVLRRLADLDAGTQVVVGGLGDCLRDDVLVTALDAVPCDRTRDGEYDLVVLDTGRPDRTECYLIDDFGDLGANGSCTLFPHLVGIPHLVDVSVRCRLCHVPAPIVFSTGVEPAVETGQNRRNGEEGVHAARLVGGAT